MDKEIRRDTGTINIPEGESDWTLQQAEAGGDID